MKLLRLRLRNFRQHADSTIDFDSGMTAIVGANGTGKSTIVEAIGFALYGEQRDTREHVRFYWAEGRGMSVALEFEFDGRRFVAERKPNDAELKELGEKERVWATGLRPVAEACTRLLGLNYEQFKNSFLAEQKGLAFLQFGTKRARQEEVARMLGFDRLKQAEELAAMRRTSLSGQVAALEAALGDPRDAQRRRDDAAALAKAIAKELRDSESAVKSLSKRLRSSEKTAERARRWLDLTAKLREATGVARVLNEAAEHARTLLEAAQRDVAELASLAVEEAEYGGLARRQAQDVTYERAPIEDRISELRGILGRTGIHPAGSHSPDQIRKAFDDAMARWQTDQTEAKSSVTAAQTRLEAAETALAAAVRALDTGLCPECGQPTGPDYASIVEERRNSCRERREELSIARQSVRRSEMVPEEVESARAALERADAEREIENLAARLAMLPAPLSTDESARLDQLRASHARHEQLRDAPTRLQDRQFAAEEAERRHDDVLGEIHSLERARAEYEFEDDLGAAEAIATHASLQRELAIAETRASEKRTQAEFVGRSLAVAEERLKEHRERAAELTALQNDLAYHLAAVAEIRRLRQSLNAAIGPDLAARASENLSLLTNGRYDTLVLDGDFVPVLVEDGVRKAVLSGGEEDVVSLALRLALSELIQERQGRPMSLLILDEVFGSLDSDRRQAVLDRLTALKGRFQQILVISHIEEINQVADQCLYLTRSPETRATIVGDAPSAVGPGTLSF